MAKDVGVHSGMHDTGRGWGTALFHLGMAVLGCIAGAIACYADALWSKDALDTFIKDPMFSWGVTLLYNTFGQFVVAAMLAAPEFMRK